MDIPDELAGELERHAQRRGRQTADYVLELVRLALLLEELPIAEVGRAAGTLWALVEARNRVMHPPAPAQIRTDLATGLPVIHSPPHAPVHSMSAADVLALEQAILEEEDLKRAGLPL